MPQTPLHLRGGRAGATLSTYPYGECWVDSKASRVKCTTSFLTPLHLRGVAKLTEADGAENPSRLAKQPRSGLAFTGWRRPNASVVRVQEVFPCTPATWRTRVGSAHGVGKTLGGRSRGKCAVGTHFKGFGLQGTEPALCSLAWLSGQDRWAHVAVSLKRPHAPCAPLSLDNLQVLVQSLPMAFG